MSDIKRLLSKKTWTGKELGILELSNMAVRFDRQRQPLPHNGKEPDGLFTDGEFQKMVNGSLEEHPEEVLTYNQYLSIHEWLSHAYNIGGGMVQQAQSNYKDLLNCSHYSPLLCTCQVLSS